jgi:TRAP transporter TAXI family solute receptor
MFRRLPASTLTFLTIAGLVFAVWYFLKPAPPSRIVMSTGVADGAYARFAERYAELLARDGVEVMLRPSAGALENLDRLTKAEVDLAIVQSGLASPQQREDLISLGNLYFEPLWVVYRGETPLRQLTELAGKRIGIGLPGSGTRVVALKLLGLNGIGADQATLVDGDVRSLSLKLKQGELDAMFAVLAPRSPLFSELLQASDLSIMNMARALSYQRRLPEMTRVTLPAGVLDLQKNVPPDDTDTVAVSATLVATKSLHPAIMFLLVRAAREIHADPDLVSDMRSFPTIAGFQEFAVPEHVRRLYTEGPPFLYQHLPYWLANLIYRLWLVAIAAFAIFVAVTDWIPKLYRYVLNLRVGQNYLAARRLEDEIRRTSDGAELERLVERLQALRRHSQSLSMPILLEPNKSALERRLDAVEQAIQRQRQADPAGDPARAAAMQQSLRNESPVEGPTRAK